MSDTISINRFKERVEIDWVNYSVLFYKDGKVIKKLVPEQEASKTSYSPVSDAIHLTRKQAGEVGKIISMYADDLFYFSRSIVLECQKKGVRMAPCYSEFGNGAKQALAILDTAIKEKK